MPFLILVVFSLLFSVPSYANSPHPRENPLKSEGITLGLAQEATANLQKEFTLEGFFAGETIAKGQIFSKLAGAGRSFQMTTKGSWDGEVLTLQEKYIYASGVEKRLWSFKKIGKSRYLVESEEILQPSELIIEGRVAKLEYKKKIPRGGGKKPVKVTFKEEWIFKPNGVLESRTELKKLFRVGREAINFVRLENKESLKAPGF